LTYVRRANRSKETKGLEPADEAAALGLAAGLGNEGAGLVPGVAAVGSVAPGAGVAAGNAVGLGDGCGVGVGGGASVGCPSGWIDGTSRM
jgi:hypothetical protein